MLQFLSKITLLLTLSHAAWWNDPNTCDCDARSFFVEYTSSYTRHDVTYGYDIYCYTYLITRSEDYNQHDKCTEQINYVTLGVSTDTCDHQVTDLQHIIVDYGASAQYNCTTQLIRDEIHGILGMKYDCDFAPYNDVNIYFCTTIPDMANDTDAQIAYVSNNNYAYTCDDEKVPNFCGDQPDYHPPPVIPPTPKPTWPTRYPTETPTRDPTGFPTEIPTRDPTRNPTSEPTDFPSEEPTTDPTDAPTETPTAAPTETPTTDPTREPTSDPTAFPTPEPTRKPTESPNMAACPIEDATDIVFLHDTSCYNGLNQCNDDQMEFVAELFSSVIGPNNNNRGAYIRFDTFTTYNDIALDDDAYDDLPISQQDLNGLYFKIRQLPYTNTGDIPDLNTALYAAYQQFDIVGESDDDNRDKKIVIISNDYCPFPDLICQNHESLLGKSIQGIDVTMVNMGRQAPLNYLMCLVNYDETELFYAPIVESAELSALIPGVQSEICSQPTPAPTVNPTRDPTTDPTDYPTENPTPIPTRDPTNNPTVHPTYEPTREPTVEPTLNPTENPTFSPTDAPTDWPTVSPTTDPTNFPTDYPTGNPTVNPTRDPTKEPTRDPTEWPTEMPTPNPTESPTNAPTTYPTPAPTHMPTPSPNQQACENGGKLDIVFLIDTSSVLSPNECADRNEFAGEVYTSVKGSENIVRAAYIRFGGSDVSVDIGLDAAPFNTVLPASVADINALYNYIRTLPCDTSVTGGVNLSGALQAAFDQFDNVGMSDADGRDKKIMILSNNYVSAGEKQQLCVDNQERIRKEGVNILMVNLGDEVYDNEDYIMCLVGFDEDRIFEQENIKFNPDLEFMIPEIRTELCSAPTDAPTVDPTNFPTHIPTEEPTDFPSENPTLDPTDFPTNAPTDSPTNDPSVSPTRDPTHEPTTDPTPWPSEQPTRDPTYEPTRDPTAFPTDYPTENPTPWPTGAPTDSPTNNPSGSPTRDPTYEPTDLPTEIPTRDPTKDPTVHPTTSPTNTACPLLESFEFAIVVDNTCGLNYNECLIQRDQIAELLSMLKADNPVDNPKVSYIEYNADGAIVRVSLDDPKQANTRLFYNYIRNHAVCGDGGDGNTDLFAGLQLALDEFDNHGNPNAIQKIITINNCVAQHINSSYDASADDPSDLNVIPQESIICTEIVQAMNAQDIDGYVINIPAPANLAINTITNAHTYMNCLADDDDGRVYSGGHHTQQFDIKEYEHALHNAIADLCAIPTTSPTVDPTNFPTDNPTPWPTPWPTLHPTDAPTGSPTYEPTLLPTRDPTVDPTRDPSYEPTDFPTENPSYNPTRDPTYYPTDYPTQDPTVRPTAHPTPSPNMEACENGGRLDIVFLVDTSRDMSEDECRAQNEFIAEVYTSVKGAQNIVRAAYIRFDADNQHIDVSLNAPPYNIRDANPAQSDMNILYNFIRDQPCTTTASSSDGFGSVGLNDALAAAYTQFDDVGQSDGAEYNGQTWAKRDKKIIILSNNYLALPEQDEVCAINKDKIRTGLYTPPQPSDRPVNAINVVMINLRRNVFPDDYIMCLVGYDDSRIYTAPVVNFSPELEDIVPSVRDEVCSSPTIAPTTDPTRDPTVNPTPWPTPFPTGSPTNAPTDNPTVSPTRDPTYEPTQVPTRDPTSDPTHIPTRDPTADPTDYPTENPTFDPTPAPTDSPSMSPTPKPTRWPTPEPTERPTQWPTPAPTPGPTVNPTKGPTQSPTNEACVLNDIFEFAIVVDNSCGLTDDECDVQRDQIAELYSLIKENNNIDNPKVTYIEYGANGAVVRVPMETGMQAQSRKYYDFIRNNGHCGGDGGGQSDLVSGLDAALDEFSYYGNPGAIHKIITVNNCKNTVDTADICGRIKQSMIDDDIEAVVINIPAPNGRQPNVISSAEKDTYLSCFSDNICAPDIDDSSEIIENEYSNAYGQCLPAICETPATLAPTMTKQPTKYVWPTPEPSREPTTWPTNEPSIAPTKAWWSSVTTTQTPSRSPTKWPTKSPSYIPSRDPTSVPTAQPTTQFPTPEPTPMPSKWPTLIPTNDPTIMDPTPHPSPNPTARPTPMPVLQTPNTNMPSLVSVITTTAVMVTNVSCPVCLADDDGSDDFTVYFADPKPPKDIIFAAQSGGISKRDPSVLNMITNEEVENGTFTHKVSNYSAWTYFVVLAIVGLNVLLCLWYVLKYDKREKILGYIAGHKTENRPLSITEADVSDFEDEDEDEDEYRTSGDEYTSDEHESIGN